jgi:hypothetical protein
MPNRGAALRCGRRFVCLRLPLGIYSQRATSLIAIRHPGRAIREPRGFNRDLDRPCVATVGERTGVVRSGEEQARLGVASRAMNSLATCQRAIKFKPLDGQFARVSKGHSDAIPVCLAVDQSNWASDDSPRLVDEGTYDNDDQDAFPISHAATPSGTYPSPKILKGSLRSGRVRSGRASIAPSEKHDCCY